RERHVDLDGRVRADGPQSDAARARTHDGMAVRRLRRRDRRRDGHLRQAHRQPLRRPDATRTSQGVVGAERAGGRRRRAGAEAGAGRRSEMTPTSERHSVRTHTKKGSQMQAKKRWYWTALLASLIGLVAVFGTGLGTAGTASSPEHYNAKSALLIKAFGTDKNVPKPVLAAVTRAAVPFTGAKLALALKCWKENICDTGTNGKVTVALADGFGENVWREVTHMEFVPGALTYPEIGKIIYTSGQNNTQKQISDFRSLIAQKVDVIVGFPDAG